MSQTTNQKMYNSVLRREPFENKRFKVFFCGENGEWSKRHSQYHHLTRQTEGDIDGEWYAVNLEPFKSGEHCYYMLLSSRN